MNFYRYWVYDIRMSWDYLPFWTEMMKQLRAEFSAQEFAMWLARIEYLRSSEANIHVRVPSPFFRDQVVRRYQELLTERFGKLAGVQPTLIFEVNDNSERPTAKPIVVGRKKIHITKRTSSQLNSEYTFENFVIGDNSSFAANAAMAIARNPGTSYNPCLIYGGVGLGKTHLIQSIGNWLVNSEQRLNIIYVTMETFTNDFIMSIQQKKTQAFKNRYRQADLLLIDDIHFLQKKPETQEELFHTFNAMYNANKQMVFTCDRPVSDIRDMTDRLRNRFERGLNVDLQPPSYETRIAIINKKMERISINIPDSVVEMICSNITTNVRDLEAALTKLIAYSELVEERISLSNATKLLKDYFVSQKQLNISINTIQRAVADYFKLSINDLKGQKRARQYSLPRQLAMYITRELTEFSTTEIGNEFGGRDHTTVIARMPACRRTYGIRSNDGKPQSSHSSELFQIRVEYVDKSIQSINRVISMLSL